jgi:multidrug transporter EmrE-like cation transporter
MSTLALILTSVFFGVIGQLAMKKGMNTVGFISLQDIFSKKFFSIIFEKYVFIGVLMYGLASIIWLVVLSQVELSYAYPLIGLGYILVAILSKVLFNESLTFFKIVGIFLIAFGAYLIVVKW